MDNIFLTEDHDGVLKIWRQRHIKNLDLVHIDAHMDFGFHLAKPIEEVLKEAKNLREIKRGLEYSLAYMSYEKDFDKQTNIGNFVYPAMEEGIVRDFYWVVPGGMKEFRESRRVIKNIVRNLTRHRYQVTGNTLKQGIISTNILGRRFIICTLEKLPVLKEELLLDIDTDFLVVDSLLNANNTHQIGKRIPWILPRDLVETLREKIKKPDTITISYSVNGGYTPIIYKHLGDEIAYHFAPKRFKERFERNFLAGQYFNLFRTTNKREYYRKALELNPAYRAPDNNYGPLYLSMRKYSLADKEYSRIQKVDPKNPGCLLGLGKTALRNKDFRRARRCFLSILGSRNNSLFTKVKHQSFLELAKVEFRLKNLKRAERLLLHYRAIEPMSSETCYLLGRIFEKDGKYLKAITCYKDAIRLGYPELGLLERLLRISGYIKERNGIIEYIIEKYRQFKKGFLMRKRLSLKKDKKVEGLEKVEGKMLVLEKRLQKEARQWKVTWS